MPVPLWGPNAGTDRINCLKYKWLHCITSMHCFYYIQYCKVFKGFFSFLFSLCFFHAKDIFSSQLLLIIITSSPRVDEAFVSSGNLKSQSFFILIPDGAIRPAPPITFSFLYTYHSHAGNELCEKKQKKNRRRICGCRFFFAIYVHGQRPSILFLIRSIINS